MILWQGKNLIVQTAAPARLVASKLIRYDETDQSDIHFLCFQHQLNFNQIRKAVSELPDPFQTDILVLENLESLKMDMHLWRPTS
jgi:hypothetical protein